MKWKTILILLSVFAVNCTYLRQPSKDQKELDPNTVKSPGGFENVAPEAKKIVTPEYAQPKVEVALNVKSTGVVQRTWPIGTTPLPKQGRVFNANTGTFDNVPYVDNKKITATTTTWAPTETIQTVTLDMNSGKAIPAPNTAKMPKENHGTLA